MRPPFYASSLDPIVRLGVRPDPGEPADGVPVLRRRGPRQPHTDATYAKVRRLIGQLCVGGVDLSRAPRAAVEDFLANRERPPEKDLPPRGSRGSRRWREHAWMMERER